MEWKLVSTQITRKKLRTRSSDALPSPTGKEYVYPEFPKDGPHNGTDATWVHFSMRLSTSSFWGKGLETDIPKKNRPRNQFIVAIFKFDKIKFKWKLIISDNEKDTAYLSKGKSHQKDIDIITIYAPSIKIPDIKETTLYLSSNIYPHTVIVDDFSTILSPVVKKSGQ